MNNNQLVTHIIEAMEQMRQTKGVEG